METDDDDGATCAQITVSTPNFCEANGFRALGPFTLAIERVDGQVVPLGIESVERLVEFVREMNPPAVHLAALDDEHEALIAEIRAQVAGDMVAAIVSAPTAPGEMLH